MDNQHKPVPLSQRLLSYLICALIAWQPLLPALAANITPVGKGTQLDKAANGVPVINIAKPNQAGLSHNQYQQYNVGKEGLILNNATGQLNQTQLGGLIQNNPNLKAGQEAKAIINEVTGANRSQLQGYTEVAGKAANVMVANPYGITCNGCGFINTPNATLTTGKPTLDAQGNLQALEVSKGSIIVEGQGLDASQSDALSVIARATEINAAIHAKDLTLIAGANRVAQDGSVTPIAGAGAAPGVAVDTGALGGMYANRIHLISSEKGVGVNLGNLNARQGDMVLDASGKLTLKNSLTSGALTAKGDSIALSGDHKAGGAVTLNAQRDVTLNAGALVSDSAIALSGSGQLALNNGKLTAGKDIQLRAAEIKTDKNSAADSATNIALTARNSIDNAGQLTAGKTLNLRAQQVENSGALVVKGDQLVNASKLNNSGKMVGDSLTIEGSTLTNSGEMLSGKRSEIKADRLTQTGTLSSQGATQLTLADTLENGGAIASSETLKMTSGKLLNRGSLSAPQLALGTSQLTNSGLIQGNNLLTLSADRLDNLSGGSIASANDVELNLPTLNNSGLITSDTGLLLSGDSLNNDGTLLSGGALALQNDTINNQGLMQGDKLSLKAHDWQNSGNTLSSNDADLQVTTLNNSGKILGQHGIQLQADSTDNSGWLLAQALRLQGDLINSGLLQGNDSLSLNGNTISNHAAGQLLSGGSLAVSATQLDNQGALQADSLQINAENWQNGGSARAAQQLDATVNNRIDNVGSLISEQALALSAGQIFNQGKLAGDQVNLTAPLLTNSGLLQSNSTLALNNSQLTNQKDGELLSGSPLSLTLDRLDNDGLLQVNGALDVTARQFGNSGRILADAVVAHADETLGNSGELLARQQATLNAQTLNNLGTLVAQDVKLTADALHNNGVVQGDNRLDITAQQLDNQNNGRLLSGGNLTLHGDSISNDGSWQGQRLDFNLGSLANHGTINASETLTGSVRDELNNSGKMLSQGNGSLTASSLLNSGKIMADSLMLRGQTLNNGGLWQGSSLLDAQGDSLSSTAGSRTLSGGLLSLTGEQLITDGTLQGEQAQVTANDWRHQGSLLGNSELTTSVAGQLVNNGGLLSQGDAQIQAQTLINQGDLLSAGAMTLTGDRLDNSGSVQGKTLAIAPAKVVNQGSLIGLQALTLGALPQAAGRIMLMAAASARQLINNNGGSLLTQGALTINGDVVTNNGSWQGQQILLNAQRLTNGGAIQSADGLQLQLTDKLDSTAGSKITANGTAALQALALTNQGEWIAKNLTLNGNTLNNGGNISGVDGLTVKLNGALTQQQDKTLLTAGKLNLQTASTNNAGRIQGGELEITSGALDNSGRIQGDKNLLLTLNGRLTNAASGTLISQNGLTLTAPELYNYGLIQGGGTTGIKTTGLTNNAGKLLSGDTLTLTTPQLTNTGWLQATQLILNATNGSNSGTLLAQQQGTLTGNGFNNQGSAQGNNLTVNYQQLTNSGTLLGNNQLNVTATQINQQAAGKLFSGGNMVLSSNGFDQLGQVVALGDASLKLINSFTNKGTLAAGNRLSVNSNGALENQGTMQGQALTVGAGGNLSNNGQLTSGSGDSTLSGNRIAMNGSGTLQGGGNIALTSRSDITLDGFTGTLGNLTLNAPGSIINTALLYAANNLYLYANSIKNQQGDMLAGNSLWMQRDAAGNANAEVINSSGNIETQNGDISVKTGHLLNERAGFSANEQVSTSSIPAWATGETSIGIPVSWLPAGSYGIYYTEGPMHHGHGDWWSEKIPHYAPYSRADVQKVPISVTTVTVNPGGNQSRISSGRDINGQVNNLENFASSILAERNIALSGSDLNNKTWTEGTTTKYGTYRYGVGAINPARPSSGAGGSPKSKSILYTLDGPFTYETVGSGNVYRGVIQAAGNITANFSNNISNTNISAGVTGVTAGLSPNAKKGKALRARLTGLGVLRETTRQDHFRGAGYGLV